jgi:hypothetical protein
MPKVLGKEVKRAHIWLFADDLDRIDRLCRTSKSNLTRSDMLRQIIHSTLNKIEEKANANSRVVAAIEPELPAGGSGRDESE